MCILICRSCIPVVIVLTTYNWKRMALSPSFVGLLGRKNTVFTMFLPPGSKNIPHNTLQIGAINSLVSECVRYLCQIFHWLLKWKVVRSSDCHTLRSDIVDVRTPICAQNLLDKSLHLSHRHLRPKGGGERKLRFIWAWKMMGFWRDFDMLKTDFLETWQDLSRPSPGSFGGGVGLRPALPLADARVTPASYS